MATKKKTTPALSEVIHGFKVTDADMKCRGTQYELHTEHTLKGKPVLCESGFHFCRVANDCFNYYPFDPQNRVFAIEAGGETVHGEDKSATNAIRFVREFTWPEVLVLVNQGKHNTGRGNTGNLNTGNLNTGDWNTGNRNTGNWNTGDWNTGNWNTGDWNTGNLNTGNRNTGNWNTGNLNTGNRNTGNLNTGNRNTGDWNTGNLNTGVFCTQSPAAIEFFNQPSDWSYQQWLDSEAHSLKSRVVLTEWRSWSAMTDHEKEQYPRAETAEGYLKKHDYKEAHKTWWDKLNDREKGEITGLPNFSKEVFLEITGIEV